MSNINFVSFEMQEEFYHHTYSGQYWQTKIVWICEKNNFHVFRLLLNKWGAFHMSLATLFYAGAGAEVSLQVVWTGEKELLPFQI